MANCNDKNRDPKHNCSKEHKKNSCSQETTLLGFVFNVFKRVFSGIVNLFGCFADPEKYSVLFHELKAHGWYTFISILLAIFCLKFLDYIAVFNSANINWPSIFHVSHYAHTLFAATTATLVSMKYSKNLLKSVLVGFFVPPFFCALSDIFMPYAGGLLLSVPMELHLCIFHNPFFLAAIMIAGVCLGVVLHYSVSQNLWIVCISSHFLHDFVSTIASLAYLISFGYQSWWSDLWIVVLLMLVAVAIPCMISDLVLPILISVEGSVWKENKTCCK